MKLFWALILFHTKERKLWEIDQVINDRGLYVDRSFVERANRLATRAKKEAIEKQNELTGLDNANSNSQLLSRSRTRLSWQFAP